MNGPMDEKLERIGLVKTTVCPAVTIGKEKKKMSNTSSASFRVPLTLAWNHRCVFILHTCFVRCANPQNVSFTLEPTREASVPDDQTAQAANELRSAPAWSTGVCLRRALRVQGRLIGRCSFPKKYT